MERIRRFFKKLGKKIGNKGYTLIEVACVVAVTATLAAVALPIVKSNVMEAKTVAATENMNNLAGAIQKYYGDTTFWPNKDVTLTAVVLRTSDGADPIITGPWITANTVILSDVLTKNTALRASWKGPYSSKSELFDPWGHPYYVAIEDALFGGQGAGAADPNHSTAIFVLSAGPDETIQTTLRQDMQTFVKAGGDIVLRIR